MQAEDAHVVDDRSDSPHPVSLIVRMARVMARADHWLAPFGIKMTVIVLFGRPPDSGTIAFPFSAIRWVLHGCQLSQAEVGQFCWWIVPEILKT